MFRRGIRGRGNRRGIDAGSGPDRSLNLSPSTFTEGENVELTGTGGADFVGTSFVWKDAGVTIDTDADGAPIEATYAAPLPGSHSITITIDGTTTFGPAPLTGTPSSPVMSSPSTTNISIGSTVNFVSTVPYAVAVGFATSNTTSIKVYNGNPASGGTLLGTQTTPSGDTYTVAVDTTGMSPGDLNIWLRRTYTSTSGSATVDVNTGVVLTLQAVTARHVIYKNFLATDAAWPVPADIKSIAGVANQVYGSCVGGGGGGQAAAGGGGGGGCSVEPAIAVTPSGTLAVTVGAGGNTSGSDGTDSSIASACVAKGGKGRANGGQGGQASDGTGTTKTNGGDGTAGAGTVAGGGSGGTSTSAAAGVPGAPDGALGATGTAHRPGAGGLSQAGAGFAGAPGSCVLGYSIPAPTGYSRCLGVTWGRDTANGTTRNITLPPGSGGRNVLVVWSDSAASPPTIAISGWTQPSNSPVDQGSAIRGAVFHVVSNGSEAVALTTSTSEAVAWICMRWESSSGGTPGAPEVASTSASSTNPDPPNLTPSGGSAKYNWIASVGWDAAAAVHSATAYPTGYTDWVLEVPAAFTTAVAMVLSVKQAEAASENPGTFTATSNPWGAFTIAIPPT